MPSWWTPERRETWRIHDPWLAAALQCDLDYRGARSDFRASDDAAIGRILAHYGRSEPTRGNLRIARMAQGRIGRPTASDPEAHLTADAARADAMVQYDAALADARAIVRITASLETGEEVPA